MKLNKYTISNASFIVFDETTEQNFGGRIDFENNNVDIEDFPDEICFSNIKELKDTIEVLTDIYQRAINFRHKMKKG